MLCGRTKCPIQSRIDAMRPMTYRITKNSLFGASPPAVFVGRWGYPHVSVGPMVPPVRGEEARGLDDPPSWYGKGIEDVISLRSKLVRSSFRANVCTVRRPGKLLELTQELAMSSNPVDTEVWLKKPPNLRIRYDGILSPMGPSGMIEDARLSENPTVDRAVDRIVYDHDVLTTDALQELYTHGIDVYQASRLMSAGLLGMKKDRRLVPTRWAITAVDSNLGDHLRSRINQNQELSEILLFSAEYLGNHFEILMLPGPYSFELIEMWLPRSVWIGDGPTQVVSDYEDWRSRTKYSLLGGGYYATRLAALEHLNNIGRQAKILAIREISPSYWAPLGVWVVRETARRAFAGEPHRFDTVEGAIEFMAHKLKVQKNRWAAESTLLRELREQLKLEQFVGR